MVTHETLLPSQIVTQPEHNLIALEGEIDLHESPTVREALRGLIEKKLPHVFVDMAAVTYIDSSGLAVLIEAMQKVHGYGGRLALCGIRDNVRTVFELARLDQVFKIFPDVKSAMGGL